jgi:hypothetical protein
VSPFVLAWWLMGQLLAADPAAGAEGAPRTFAVRAPSAIAYLGAHPLHSVDGISREVEGRARLLPGGAVQVTVRVRVESFESGLGYLDVRTRETLEAARFAYVTLEATGAGAAPPATPSSVELLLRGELELHGVVRHLEVPVTVRWENPARAEVEGRFTLSLEAHGVDRPSLLLVKVEDLVEVHAWLTLEQEQEQE